MKLKVSILFAAMGIIFCAETSPSPDKPTDSSGNPSTGSKTELEEIKEGESETMGIAVQEDSDIYEDLKSNDYPDF